MIFRPCFTLDLLKSFEAQIFISQDFVFQRMLGYAILIALEFIFFCFFCQALEQTVNLLESQGRHNAQKRVILFANGKSGANPSHLKKYASLLEDANVKIVTVAVGDDVNEEELRHINPDEEAIIKVDTREDAESAVFAVARQVQGRNFCEFYICEQFESIFFSFVHFLCRTL